jgi:hypothetical protein
VALSFTRIDCSERVPIRTFLQAKFYEGDSVRSCFGGFGNHYIHGAVVEQRGMAVEEQRLDVGW